MKIKVVIEICLKNDWFEYKNLKLNWKLCDSIRFDLKKFWNYDSFN